MNRSFFKTMTGTAVLTFASLLPIIPTFGQTSAPKEAPLVPSKVAGDRWIELSLCSQRIPKTSSSKTLAFKAAHR